MRTPAWCRRQAAGIGPSCDYLIGELLAENALTGCGSRAGHHRPGRQARPRPAARPPARRPSQPGDPSYRTVKGILAAGAEREQLPAAAGDGGAPAFLRGPASFANVIPMPGTVTSDAVRPGTTAQVTS